MHLVIYLKVNISGGGGVCETSLLIFFDGANVAQIHINSALNIDHKKIQQFKLLGGCWSDER